MTTPHTDLLPLALLATEWGETPEALAADLNPSAIHTDLGIRYITRHTARELLERRNRAAQARAQAQAAQREHLDAMLAPTLARVQAIQAKQHAQRANGDIDSGTPAFVAMTLGDPNNRLEAAGRRYDDMLNAGRAGNYSSMYKFQPTPNQEVQP
jgi:hypothetical protein